MQQQDHPGTWGSHATSVEDNVGCFRLAGGVRLRLHRRQGDYPTRHPGRLETGKSTKAEVTALLGFPVLVTYGRKGEETWNYYYVTEYPQAVDFVPVMNSLSPGFKQTTRVLTVSFDRQGLVQNLQKSRTTGKAEIYPY